MDKWERGEYKNPYLLRFNKKEEKRFMLAVKKADTTLFKSITVITIILTSLFILIDIGRVQEKYHLVLILRGSALLFFIGTYFFITNRNIAPSFLQKLITASLLFICISFFLLDYFAPMPTFFLPNALVTVGFFGITISGLRFRNGLIFEAFLLSSFIPYAFLISESNYLSSQVPNLLTNVILGIMCGYTLERVRRTSYLRNEKIASQNTVIRSKNNKLKGLITSKNKLISILSHDLRSPINSLKSLLNMRIAGDVSIEEFDNYIMQISERIELTENLIENILMWAKSQVSDDFLQPYPFSLMELTKKNMEFFEENAALKNIQLKLSSEEDVVVNAHEESVNMVIRNLISNALKFTPSGGEICMDFKKNDKYAEFQITDSGVGIPEKNLSKIFGYENFTTLGTNKEKGSGLGLAICQDFIVKNKGKIWVENNEEKGATFKFKLPLL
jgi:signal transduction histidine kinase